MSKDMKGIRRLAKTVVVKAVCDPSSPVSSRFPNSRRKTSCPKTRTGPKAISAPSSAPITTCRVPHRCPQAAPAASAIGALGIGLATDRDGHERDDHNRPPETSARDQHLEPLTFHHSACLCEHRRRERPHAEQDNPENRHRQEDDSAQTHLRSPRRPLPAGRGHHSRQPSIRRCQSPALTPPGRWR